MEFMHNERFHKIAKRTIDLYNKNQLSKDILINLFKHYRGNPIGMVPRDKYKSNDGKFVLQIICSVIEPKNYALLEQKYNLPLEDTKESKKELEHFGQDVYDLWDKKIVSRFNFSQ